MDKINEGSGKYDYEVTIDSKNYSYKNYGIEFFKKNLVSEYAKYMKLNNMRIKNNTKFDPCLKDAAFLAVIKKIFLEIKNDYILLEKNLKQIDALKKLYYHITGSYISFMPKEI